MWTDTRVVLLLLALSPAAGWAQAAPLEHTPPPLVRAPPEVLPPEAVPSQEVAEARAQEAYSLSPARVTVEGLVGGIGGIVGGLSSGAVGVMSGVGMRCRGDVCDGDRLGALIIMGFAVASAPSVYGAGSVMGGHGRFLPTMAAGVLAGGASAGLYLAGSQGSDATLVLLGLPLVASVVTYEASAALSSPRSSVTDSASSPQWAPTVSLVRGGGSLGLTGRF